MPKERQGLVRSLFFSSDLPEDAFQRYHAHLQSQPSILPVSAKELKDVCLPFSLLRPCANLLCRLCIDKSQMPCYLEPCQEASLYFPCCQETSVQAVVTQA